MGLESDQPEANKLRDRGQRRPAKAGHSHDASWSFSWYTECILTVYECPFNVADERCHETKPCPLVISDDLFASFR
jgi:hypothetical protein